MTKLVNNDSKEVLLLLGLGPVDQALNLVRVVVNHFLVMGFNSTLQILSIFSVNFLVGWVAEWGEEEEWGEWEAWEVLHSTLVQEATLVEDLLNNQLRIGTTSKMMVFILYLTKNFLIAHPLKYR